MFNIRRVKNKSDLDHLYKLFNELEDRIGGKKTLNEMNSKSINFKNGVYIFYDKNEYRKNNDENRIIRVGTHAINKKSKSSLWSRLRSHRGVKKGDYKGGGNHRGSIFRLHVGNAIINKLSLKSYPYWGVGKITVKENKIKEHDLEIKVSNYINELPLLWLEVDDNLLGHNIRSLIEKNLITLASGYHKDLPFIDPPSSHWLGHYSMNDFIKKSGLWNVRHVSEYLIDGVFFDILEDKINKM